MSSQPISPADDIKGSNGAKPAPDNFADVLQREQLFDEFESGWQSATRPIIETFLGRVSESDREDVLRELLGIELDQRLRRGEVPQFEEYRARFPDQAAVVEAAYREGTKAPGSGPSPKVARFLPIDRLGVGGQGEVWLMLDPQIDRRVALKILQPSLQGTEPSLSSFRREAEVSGKLEHPNIVPVYDVTAELNESGQADPNSPCYVMRVFGDPRLHVAIAAFHERPRSPEDQKLLAALRAFDKEQSPEHRQELKDRLAKFSFDPQQECDQTLKTNVESILQKASEAGTLTKAISKLHGGEWSESLLRKLLNRFQRICEGVAYAHSRGVIHRDLKPDNVMLGEYGETLVADWGLAKLVGRDEEHQIANVEVTLRVSSNVADPHQTQRDDLKGTPAYMSPEQAMRRHGELGPATDIYSLGAILYCILTGQSAFKGKTVAEVLQRVRDGEFPRPTEVEPRVSKALEAIVLKAMSLEPRDRYAKARDLTADVERWLNDEPVSAWPEPFTVRAKRWAKNHQTAVTSTAAAILVATVTLSVMFVVVTGQKANLSHANGEILRQSEQINHQNDSLRKSNEELTLAKNDADLKRQRAEAAETLAAANAEVAKEQSNLALKTFGKMVFGFKDELRKSQVGVAIKRQIISLLLDNVDELSKEFLEASTLDQANEALFLEVAGALVDIGVEERGDNFIGRTLTTLGQKGT